VTIPASKLIRYIETADTWILRDTQGAPIKQIDRTELDWISRCGDESAFGIGSATRLKYVKLSIAYDSLHERMVKILLPEQQARMDRMCGRLPKEPAYSEIEFGLTWQHLPRSLWLTPWDAALRAAK
jgi:hypothetical protein